MTAITRSRWHQYVMGDHGPYPGCTALCGMQDATQGPDGLITWGVKGALDEYERVLRESKSWEQARTVAVKWPSQARDLGTDVHTAVDQFNRGEPLSITGDTAPYVAQYAAWLRNNNVEVLGSEKYVINTEIGFGGTYDSLLRIDGELALCDVKTGKEKISQRLQLTGLSLGEYHGEAGLEAERMPEMSGVGWILLLRPDGYDLRRHEITDADREHFARLVQTFHAIRSWAAEFAPTELREAA